MSAAGLQARGSGKLAGSSALATGIPRCLGPRERLARVLVMHFYAAYQLYNLGTLTPYRRSH